MDTDVVIVGAGAAGMLCAATAAARGRRVLLLDHRGRIGERIRVSGGGRCNVTNRFASADTFLSRNPHFCRSALARFTPADMLAMLDRHDVPWEERSRGQIFCVRSAEDVVSMLRRACDAAGVTTVAPCTVEAVERLPERSDVARRFRLATTVGTLACQSLVVATGGLAVPKLGASPFGYRLAEQFGIPVVTPRPGLVPLTLADDPFAWLRPLTGVAFETRAQCRTATASPAFDGRALITHRGLSGPAVLQASSYWQYGDAPTGTVTFNLVPDRDIDAWLDAGRQGRRTLVSWLSGVIPRRLAEALALAYAWPDCLAECPKRSLAAIARTLSCWTLHPIGTLGFEKAEVTVGGVDTRALSSQTMETRDVPGLYFIGEVVDVTGWLGGYNFQWAWSSGWVAAQHV